MSIINRLTEFYGVLTDKISKIVGKPEFSEQLSKIVNVVYVINEKGITFMQ